MAASGAGDGANEMAATPRTEISEAPVTTELSEAPVKPSQDATMSTDTFTTSEVLAGEAAVDLSLEARDTHKKQVDLSLEARDSRSPSQAAKIGYDLHGNNLRRNDFHLRDLHPNDIHPSSSAGLQGLYKPMYKLESPRPHDPIPHSASSEASLGIKSLIICVLLLTILIVGVQIKRNRLSKFVPGLAGRDCHLASSR